ncbi:hypothetical protein [Rhodanobacter hydrolyticus]|uniref:hypothetical protein n=1 Tax=Rhodanobacter hydrolyticus TaxID=2250595 RepID=UPI00384D47FD
MQHDNFGPLESLAWQVHVYGALHADLSATCAEHQLSIHVFAWNADMKRAGFKRDGFYLIRPDGYVALSAPDQDPRRLHDYMHAHGMQKQ